jgi:hypothetical protein
MPDYICSLVLILCIFVEWKYEVWSPHSCDRDSNSHVRYDTTYSGRYWPTLCRHLLPPSLILLIWRWRQKVPLKCTTSKNKVNFIKLLLITRCVDWAWFYIFKLFIPVFTNFMHKTCFTISTISCLYMFRAHVLETCRGMKQYLLWNKFCASSWLNTKINILRCTVNKTSKYLNWSLCSTDCSPLL